LPRLRREPGLDATIEHAKRLLASRRYDEFLAFTERALARFPNDPEIRLLYATAIMSSRPDEAAWEAATAVSLDKENPNLAFRAAHVLFACGQYDAAETYAAHVRSIAPPDFIFTAELNQLEMKLRAIKQA
jgi:Flp pilus assembly protein TadD